MEVRVHEWSMAVSTQRDLIKQGECAYAVKMDVSAARPASETQM